MTDLLYIIVTGAVSLVLGMVLGRLVFSRVNKAEESKAKGKCRSGHQGGAGKR